MSHTTSISSQRFPQECLPLCSLKSNPRLTFGPWRSLQRSPFGGSTIHLSTTRIPTHPQGQAPLFPPLPSSNQKRRPPPQQRPYPLSPALVLPVTLPALRRESPHGPHLHFAPSRPVSILQPKLSFWSLVLHILLEIHHVSLPAKGPSLNLKDQASQGNSFQYLVLALLGCW